MRSWKEAMFENGYALSMIALLLMGTQRFLYKVSVQRGCNSLWTTFTFMGTVTILSAISLVISGESLPSMSFLVFIALINSLSFTLATLTHMEALRHLPGSVVFPIIRLNAVVVVIFSVAFFHDRLSGYQIIGILFAVVAIATLASGPNDPNTARTIPQRGFALISLCILCGAVASISSKFAAMYTNKMAFMALSYFLGTLFSWTFRNSLVVEGGDSRHKDAVIIGVVMGLLNFAGFYAFLSALTIGPLSIIVSMVGLHFVIPIILCALIYAEKITPLRILGVLLAVVSVICLRF